MACTVNKNIAHGFLLGFFALAGLIIMITLLALSVDREVSQSEYVVQYYENTKEFGPILEQGKYNVRVDTTFIYFPRTVYGLDMDSITCTSLDRIQIDLTVDVQVRLKREALIPIILKQYQSLGNYENWLKSYVKSLLISSCTSFSVNDFYLSRSQVYSSMFQTLETGINRESSIYGSTIEYFQLSNVELPDELGAVIEEKQSALQEAVTAANDRTNEVILATTAFKEAEQQALITMIEASTEANLTKNEAIVQGLIIKDKYENLAPAYESVINNLNLNIDQFIEYLSAELYNKVKSSVIN